MYICNIVANFTLAKNPSPITKYSSHIDAGILTQHHTNHLLRNWVADHTDAVRKVNDGSSDQVGYKKIYCHCDHIVAESPFTGTEAIGRRSRKIFTPEPGRGLFRLASARYYFSYADPQLYNDK